MRGNLLLDPYFCLVAHIFDTLSLLIIWMMSDLIKHPTFSTISVIYLGVISLLNFSVSPSIMRQSLSKGMI